MAVGSGAVLDAIEQSRMAACAHLRRHVFGGRTLAWDEVSGFDLMPHRRGRKERIAAVTDEGPVVLEHGDSKSLVLRPELSEQWYRAVIDRLESVRRRYV